MKATSVGLLLAAMLLLVLSAAVGTASVVFPMGTYSTVIERGDIPSWFPAQFAPMNVGRWEMTFSAAGRHTVIYNGNVVVEGQYSSAQNQIAVYKDKGPYGCDIQERDTRPWAAGTPPQVYSGVYTWAYDGKMLTFTKVADECIGRVVAFTVRPWAKRE